MKWKSRVEKDNERERIVMSSNERERVEKR